MTRLVEVLLGISAPSERIPIENTVFFDPTLNDSQKAAVEFALESPEIACIHGPPGIVVTPRPSGIESEFGAAGTGKTHTLIEVIRQLTSVGPANPKPLRVLVCSASNLAVDNILERLLALPVAKSEGRLKVTRVGHPARVMSDENILDSTLDMKAGRSDEVSEVISLNGLIGLTCTFARRHSQEMSRLNWKTLSGYSPGKGKVRKENPPAVWNGRKCGKKSARCERST